MIGRVICSAKLRRLVSLGWQVLGLYKDGHVLSGRMARGDEDTKGTSMALPPKTAPCWRKLAGGGMKSLRTKNLGAQMLAQRIELSKLGLEQKAEEIFNFFVKWERGLADEIAQLERI
jgi:hypothetical protein